MSNQQNEGEKRQQDRQPRQENPARQDGAGSSKPAGRIPAWLTGKLPKLPKGGGKFNFFNPGEPDHWLENVIEFVYQTVVMLFLHAYPLVLIYAAAVGFVPRNAQNQEQGIFLWANVLPVIATVVIDAVCRQIRTRQVRSEGKFTLYYIGSLILKSALLLFGLVYMFFQNPWSYTAQPFQFPTADLLLNPILIGLAVLIIVDTWNPQLLRSKVLYDDEKLPKPEKK